MPRLTVLPLVAAVALILAVPAWGGVPRTDDPQLDDRPDTLTVGQVHRLVERALREEYSLGDHYDRRCRRRSRLRMRCRVVWEDFDTIYYGSVEIWRTGTYGSPTDHYRFRIREIEWLFCSRRCRRLQRASGRFPTPIRRARLGQAVDAYPSGARVRVRATLAADPAPAEPFNAPNAGHRYVTFLVDAANRGDTAYDRELQGDAVVLVLHDGSTIDAEYGGALDCNSTLSVPPGEARVGCVTFAVPYGVRVRALELRPMLDESETVQWRL